MEIRKENQRKPSPKFSTQIGELVMIIDLDNEYILIFKNVKKTQRTPRTKNKQVPKHSSNYT